MKAMTVEDATRYAAKQSKKADRKMTAKAHRKASEACVAASKAHDDASGKGGDANKYASKQLSKLAKAHAMTSSALGGEGLKLEWTDEMREKSIEARKAHAAADNQAKTADDLRSSGQAREASEMYAHASKLHGEAEAMHGQRIRKLDPSKKGNKVAMNEAVAGLSEHNEGRHVAMKKSKEYAGKAEKYTEKAPARVKTGKGLDYEATRPSYVPKDKGKKLGFVFDIDPSELSFGDGKAWHSLSLADEPKHLYRKHILKLGNFTKKSDNLKFSITPREFDHFERTFAKMKQAGVKVPLPLGHTNDVHKNRGWVVGVERSKEDPRFLDAIVKCKHPDLIEENDVSVYVPPSFTDGENREWVKPIRHLALTPYPVIPGLGEFQAIAASFDPGSTAGLELDDDDDDDDDDEGDDLYIAWSSLPESRKDSLREDYDIGDDEEPTAEELQSMEDNGDLELSDEPEVIQLADHAVALAEEDPSDRNLARGAALACQEAFKATKKRQYLRLAEGYADEAGINLHSDSGRNRGVRNASPVEPAKVPKKLLKTALSQRENTLHELVLSGQATPAQVGKLAKVHCTKRAVSLSLSDDPEEQQLSDEAFEAAVQALSMNPKRSKLLAGELSGPQVNMELSNELAVPANDGNLLIADAESRAESKRDDQVVGTQRLRLGW